MASALDKLERLSFQPGSIATLTAEKDYDALQAFPNTTSYSALQALHACPRKFQLNKARAARRTSEPLNLDFAFGHAVGAGIQAWQVARMTLPPEEAMDVALLNAMLAWKAPFDGANEKKRKSLWEACHAVMLYPEFYELTQGDWEVFVLPSGKPAVELSISVDFENGYKHYMHIDVILKNALNGKLAVQENKTHGFKTVEPSIYANSSQAISYAVVVDQLSDLTSFEVFYNCYSSVGREWELLPFSKSTAQKAEWIKDLQLDHASIATYRAMNFYPKRGESCFDFMRRCPYYGECNLTSMLPTVADLPAGEEAEAVDFAFTLTEIVATQRARNDAEPEQEEKSFGFQSID